MLELISNWLTEYGIGTAHIESLTLVCSSFVMLCICLLSYYLARYQILALIQKLVLRSKNTWDDLVFEHKVFSRIAMLIPFIVLLFLIPLLTYPETLYRHLLFATSKIAVAFQIARSISALLNVFNSIYQVKAQERYLPVNSTIQVIKLLVYLVASILAISFVLDRSPLYLLSGLGALTAVLLLVFQDTIKGLVASIQISANRMLAPGDWIEIPQYGADGDVLEIGLNTVKVQNFDRTVTTVPTYALISGSFKNWRDMFSSGGRRIKRSITIDVSSIRFYQSKDIEHLKSLQLLTPYLEKKLQAIESDRVDRAITDDGDINSRQLTNLGTFRAYIEAYLKQHEKVQHEMTCMVRQLPATPTGLPLELYFFSNDQNWVNYEGIQADIFDHLYAIAPVFDIRIFQHPSGADWRNTK